MNKKILLLGIGIVAVLAVACRAKNDGENVVNTDTTETETQAGTTDTQTGTTDTHTGTGTETDPQTDAQSGNSSDVENSGEEIQPSDTGENQDTENSGENGTSQEERNLNYKDVDIKVPSIHEDK